MKDAMRREKLDIREAMSKERVERGSEAISQRLLSLRYIREAQRVMAYCAVKNEPDMWAVTYALLDMGKRVALPCVADGNIVAAEFCRDTTLQCGAYGIPQPAPGGAPFEPDIVIVPGVVFDLQLHRIGFGAGYYDRFLQHSRAVKIGVCFESQLVDTIEADPHDVRMDIIITEKRVLEAI